MKNLEFPVFLGICLLFTVQTFAGCPSMFVQLSSGQYFFSPIKASWINSWRFCRLLGANLVSIETPEEQQALVKHIQSYEQTTESSPTTALVNLSLNKAASQSSTIDVPFGASRAVDGAGIGCNCNQDCSHTDADTTPWWQVDLGNNHKVFIVSLYNRAGAPERLRDFEIRIGDKAAPNHGNNSLCGRHTGAGIAASAIFNVTCSPGPIIGRYVTVQITEGKEYLTLCEVKVLGVTAVQTTESSTPTAVSYWTSGVKMFQGKKWIWMSTGNAIAYKAWCHIEPYNDLGVEECLHFNFKEGGCWNDYNCTSDDLGDQEVRFICEMDNTCMIH